MSSPTWGVVSTIKAPARDILRFAAHHLDLGAHRVFIYLDDDNPRAHAALRAHPKCRVVQCDDAYWAKRKGGRPDKHQPRQTANATRAYRRDPQVDWLAHIDVDEFLWPQSPLEGQLAAIPGDVLSARVHPIEALAPAPGDDGKGQVWFKACARRRQRRARQTTEVYPTYGAHLNGGFLSHAAGKVLVRTGTPGLTFRIHNAFVNGEADDNAHQLNGTLLCHLHAPSWERFRDAYRYRLQLGSYRPERKPVMIGDEVGLSMYQLFSMLEDEGGEEALRRFYDEVCVATPALRERLSRHGLLHGITLDLDTKLARHFPDFT